MAVAAPQHDLITHGQLRALGLSPDAIKHRLRRGKLHRRYRGVHVVGRPRLDREAEWMAAVLVCGEGAVLSHTSAAALWRIAVEGVRRWR